MAQVSDSFRVVFRIVNNFSTFHRLVLEKLGNRGVMAQVVHYRNGVVLKASTTEWGLQKQLYRTYDTSAYINLGKVINGLHSMFDSYFSIVSFQFQVFAERCLQAGLIEMFCNIEGHPGGKIDHFLKEVENGGVILSEGERYKKAHPCDPFRMVKPWEINVD